MGMGVVSPVYRIIMGMNANLFLYIHVCRSSGQKCNYSERG